MALVCRVIYLRERSRGNDGIVKKGRRVRVDAMMTVDVRRSLWGAGSKKPEDMWISSYIVMMVAYMSTALCAIQKTWR